MKKIYKLLAVLFGVTFLMSGLAGCNRGDGDVQRVDSQKTQLYVKYYSGGLGNAWLDQCMADFETKFADYSFEEGKRGIQFMKDFEKITIQVDLVAGNPSQLFIMEGSDYNEFVSKGVLMDLTDIVTSPAVTGPDQKESETISSKISAERQSYYNVGTASEPAYYGIPFYESSLSAIYNVDLFDEQGWYLRADADTENMTYEDLQSYEKVYSLFVRPGSDAARSAGPDGKTAAAGEAYGYDDGLPATYKDFQALLTCIVSSSVYPFIWNGYSTDYLTSFALEAWANNSGCDEIKLSLTMGESGKSSLTLVDLNGDGTIKKENGEPVLRSSTEITEDNGYLLHLQEGKLDALSLVKMMIGAGYYGDSFSPSFSHRMAQGYFINGYEKGTVDKPIAMLIDGSWWNSEARTDYTSENERMTKRFATLPLPSPEKRESGEEVRNVKISERSSWMFIKKNCDPAALKAAKMFMSYLQSDEALNTFSVNTDMLRAMDYEVTEQNLNKMSYYGRDNYRLSRAETTDWVDWVPMSDATKSNPSLVEANVWGFSNGSISNPFIYFAENRSATVEDYFLDIYNYYCGDNGSNWTL